VGVEVEGEEEEDLLEEQRSRPQKTLTPEEEAEAARVRMEKLIGRRTIGRKESTPPAKKSS
jgi:hypothetical protein